MFCASRQDRRLRGLFPIASRRKLCKHWATVSQKVMYEGKTIESALARRMKVWIVASKFENVSEHVHEEIWYKHDITLYYFCTLRAESVWYYCIRVWMVTIILDLSVTFWKLSQDEIPRFRISLMWRKHRASCFRYIYVLRKRVIPSLSDSIKFQPSKVSLSPNFLTSSSGTSNKTPAGHRICFVFVRWEPFWKCYVKAIKPFK